MSSRKWGVRGSICRPGAGAASEPQGATPARVARPGMLETFPSSKQNPRREVRNLFKRFRTSLFLPPTHRRRRRPGTPNDVGARGPKKPRLWRGPRAHGGRAQGGPAGPAGGRKAPGAREGARAATQRGRAPPGEPQGRPPPQGGRRGRRAGPAPAARPRSPAQPPAGRAGATSPRRGDARGARAPEHRAPAPRGSRAQRAGGQPPRRAAPRPAHRRPRDAEEPPGGAKPRGAPGAAQEAPGRARGGGKAAAYRKKFRGAKGARNNPRGGPGRRQIWCMPGQGPRGPHTR